MIQTYKLNDGPFKYYSYGWLQSLYARRLKKQRRSDESLLREGGSSPSLDTERGVPHCSLNRRSSGRRIEQGTRYSIMVFKGKPEFDVTPPDDFDPAKPYADPVAMLEHREWLVREKYVAIEKAKILREQLRTCYWKEGVNHHRKCKDLVDKYLASIKNVGWGKDTRLHVLYSTADE